MTVQEQVDDYILAQPQPKREEMLELHRRITALSPGAQLWFLDGRNSDGKVVSNPNIGYGSTSITYANGDAKDFYQVGLSGNTTGISVYIIGIEDKAYLIETYGHRLGKAKITGYCIKFRSTGDIDLDVLEEIIAKHLGPPR